MLGSYPTLVIRGTGLYELWKTGAYKNYPPETLVDLIARVLAMVGIVVVHGLRIESYLPTPHRFLLGHACIVSNATSPCHLSLAVWRLEIFANSPWLACGSWYVTCSV